LSAQGSSEDASRLRSPPDRSVPPIRLSGSRERGRLGKFLLFALIVHVELLALAGLGLYFFAPRDADLKRKLSQESEEPVDLKLVDDAAAQEILADLEKQAEERKAEEVRKEVEATKPSGQVVDIPKPLVEQRPDDARFNAEYDATVSRQTKRHGRFDDRAQQGAAEGEERGSSAERAEPASRGARATPSAPPSPLFALRNPVHGSRGASGVSESQPASIPGADVPAEAPSPDGFMPLPPAGRAGAARAGEAASPSAAAAASPSLMPSSGQLARAVGSGTMDYLPDVDDGEETALNAKKWRFASFFNRVKKQVQEQWHPAEVYRRRDPTGAIYGHINRLTIVQVKLKPDGFLNKVFLQQPSGLDFLDDEALEAFKMAQPFPNPPKQLVEADGLIHFSFGFLFEVSDTPRMMLFKYNM
jgi:TonB family protein